MPTVQCSCGKRIGVSDALIGKSVRCSQCGQSVFVAAGAPSAARPAARQPRQAVHISGGLLATIILLVAGFTIVTLYKIGPGHVWAQWDTLGPRASDQVTDVVTFALQAYLSETYEYIPGKSKKAPGVDGLVNFFVPRLIMSMPQKLKFFGMTTQGRFTGEYNTVTGEIEADIQTGGSEVGGLIAVRKATGVIHITGRDVNPPPQAEKDGVSLKIIYPPKDKDE